MYRRVSVVEGHVLSFFGVLYGYYLFVLFRVCLVRDSIYRGVWLLFHVVVVGRLTGLVHYSYVKLLA